MILKCYQYVANTGGALVPCTYYSGTSGTTLPVLVPACNPSDSWCSWRTYHEHAQRTQNGFGRWQGWMERINRGLHSHPRGRYPCSLGGVRGTNVNARTDDGQTDRQTERGSKNDFITSRHPVAKRSWNFLT